VDNEGGGPNYLTAPIVSFLDGDTIEVLHNNRAERIRLNGIGCSTSKLRLTTE